MLTRILGSQLEWISSCQVGKNSRRKSMGRTVFIKGDILYICPLSGWDDGQGCTSGTRHFESSHGGKNSRTHFLHHSLG